MLNNFRYGREEMLALFEKHEEIHPELSEAPNLISKESLVPISLIPLTEEDQVSICSYLAIIRCYISLTAKICKTYSLL